MKRPIRKAVFPVAGLGTRFLPATKAMPKEMLVVGDRPLIQHAVDEAREAGIEHFIFITGRNKNIIEDHFDRQPELEQTLAARGKKAILDELMRSLPAPGDCSFVRQQEPLGLGHAVWCARHIVGNDPFAVLLPDMLMRGEKKGCLAQLVDVYDETGGNVIAVEECEPSQTSSYGIVGRGETKGDAFRITSMVEKPAPKDAPSNLFISGRYIFQPELFAHIAKFESGAGGEIQVTDAMRRLSAEQPFYGYRFRGRSFDCGMKPGFVAANIAVALENPELAAAVRAELKWLLAPA